MDREITTVYEDYTFDFLKADEHIFFYALVILSIHQFFSIQFVGPASVAPVATSVTSPPWPPLVAAPVVAKCVPYSSCRPVYTLNCRRWGCISLKKGPRTKDYKNSYETFLMVGQVNCSDKITTVDKDQFNRRLKDTAWSGQRERGGGGDGRVGLR